MTSRGLLVGSAAVLVALLAQDAVLSRLPLPGAAPNLLLVLVVAVALVAGPLTGTLAGFGTGLLADLASSTEIGRTAVVLTLVGYLAGTYAGRPARSFVLPFAVLGLSAAIGVTVFAAEGVLLGDRSITLAGWGVSLLSTLTYALLLGLVVLPLVRRLAQRLDRDPFAR